MIAAKTYSVEQLEAAMAYSGSIFVRVGKDLIGLKLLNGVDTLRKLNISEFQAYALMDIAQYYLYAHQAMPDLDPKVLLLFMSEHGHFDRIGNVPVIEIKNAIPQALRDELAAAIAKYRSEKETA